jgi:hypothetical protein
MAERYKVQHREVYQRIVPNIYRIAKYNLAAGNPRGPVRSRIITVFRYNLEHMNGQIVILCKFVSQRLTKWKT